LIVELSLQYLNCKQIRNFEHKLPDLFRSVFDQETLIKIQDYSLAKSELAVAQTIFSVMVMLFALFTGCLGYLDLWVNSFELGYYTEGVVFILLVGLILTLMQIPFQLYSVFFIEENFGFNKTTPFLWVTDFLKSLLVRAILFIPLLYGLFWFMHSAGRYWWIYAGLGLALFQTALIFLYPIFIAPLFNKFNPLTSGQLKVRLSELADRLQFKIQGIFVMDGSKRTSHGNAYFTGFGKNKRIVLFDTLIEKVAEEGVAAVLAHEIGHEKLNHIKKSFVLSLLIMFLGLWILSILLDFQPMYQAFGFGRASLHAALVIFIFVSEPFAYFLTPFLSILSRRFEFQADRFAIKAVSGYGDLQAALLTLSKNSLSNLTPHPWYSFFHYSHPSLYERIKAMEVFWGSEALT